MDQIMQGFERHAGACDEGLAGITKDMKRGRWVEAHAEGIVPEWNSRSGGISSCGILG